MHNQPHQPLETMQAEIDRLRKERESLREAMLALVRADETGTPRDISSYRLTLEEAKYTLEITV